LTTQAGSSPASVHTLVTHQSADRLAVGRRYLVGNWRATTPADRRLQGPVWSRGEVGLPASWRWANLTPRRILSR